MSDALIFRGFMETLVQSATILALLSFAALCVYAIFTLKDVRRTLRLVQSIEESLQRLPEELKEFRARLLNMLKNVEDTTKNVSLLTQKAAEDMQSSSGIFGELEALTVQIRKLREYLQTGIIKPLGKIAITVSALGKASEAFSETLSRNPPQKRS